MELLEGTTLASVCDKLATRSSLAASLDLPTWKETVASACSEARQAEKTLSGTEGKTPGPKSLSVDETGETDRRASRDYVRQILHLMRQVSEAAHALHEAGPIHPAIK